jgi:cytosine deaminase
LLEQALDKGVDVIGGIPHFERTMDDGAKSIRGLMKIAADRGLLVDMHCDETDDPMSRHIETLSAESLACGMQGRVAGSHLTSMHSMDNYYVSKLLPLMLESGVAAIANPLINITLQGRHDTYPKRRGLTRIRELTEAGIPVALGHDCVMDPWYAMGSHDMLDVAHMAVHAAQMTSMAEIRTMFDAVTVTAAKILQLENYGLHIGANADLVILQAATPFDAIRLRPARLYVIRRGQIISTTAPVTADVSLGGKHHSVDFTLKA